MQTAVVTGATGFLGKALTMELLHAGVTVYGTATQKESFAPFVGEDRFVPVVADLSEFKGLPGKIQKPVDVFFHFAWAGGFTDALKDYELQMRNAAYAGDALIAALEMGCKKFVQAGTYNEFEVQTILGQETTAPRYTTIYSAGKTAADLICRTLANNLGISYCIGMIPMPYGEGNNSRQLANVVLEALNEGRPPKLVEGNQYYDLVYVSDIAKAFAAIGERGMNQKGYYVGHRELRTFREWMTMIRDAVAPDVELRFGEYQDNQTIDFRLIDLDALYRDTGFVCNADFAETIRSTAQWLKAKQKGSRILPK